MRTKAEKILTYKALLIYSLKGNTKGILEGIDLSKFKVFDLMESTDIDLNPFDLIFIGTSTYGRGVPPRPFFEIRDHLYTLRGKEIGLFGSGNSHYEYFCGALDLLEELLKPKNSILFKFKFEGYPTKQKKMEFKNLINKYI